MSINSENAVIVDELLQTLTTSGYNDAYDFEYALRYVSTAFSRVGNVGWHGDQNYDPDQEEALEMYQDLAAIPDLIVEARGEEGLKIATLLEKEVNEVGKQLVFDQNTLEM